MLADLHCDTFYRCYTRQTDFTDTGLHISLEKGMEMLPYIQVFAQYVPETAENKFEFFIGLLENSFSIIEKHSEIMLYRSSADIEIAEKQGRLLAVLSVEDGDFFSGCYEDDLKKIIYLEQNHIKFISPCYNSGGKLCSGALCEHDFGLTSYGRKIAYALCEHGMAIDVSHLGHRSTAEVLGTDLPSLATHSNCFSLCNRPRNITDSSILRLIEKNGLIGINLYSPFLSGTGTARMCDVYSHIEHITSLGGRNILAMGADLDGCDTLPEQIHDVSDIKRLDIPHEVFYNNVKRFLKSM